MIFNSNFLEITHTYAIYYSINDISSETETKKHGIGVFNDVSKALDTNDHNKLLTRWNTMASSVRHNVLSNYL